MNPSSRVALTALAAWALAGAPSCARTAPSPSRPAPSGPPHPLDPLSAAELTSAVEILCAEGKLDPDARVPFVALEEPSKQALASGAPPRQAAVVVLGPGARTFEATVDLGARRVASWTERPGAQPAVTLEELRRPVAIIRADPRWQDAMRRRGITDFEHVDIDVWAPGLLSPEARAAAPRLLRAISYYRGPGGENPYLRPIEGVGVLFDAANGRVVEVTDTGVVALPPAPAAAPPSPPTLRPLVVTQPEGPSFALRGGEVHWQRWRFRFSMHPREGLVLHAVRYDDHGRERAVLHRASLSEMVVPYGDADGNWSWRNAFDVGEYGVGRLANTLRPGLDVPANARVFDAVFADDRGVPFVRRAATAVYERDGGLLLKHADFDTHTDVVRRARQLVVTSIATIGNYDYAFAWVFGETGELRFEVDLTGIMLPKGVPDVRATAAAERFGRLVAPNVVAPNHQHFFNVRLDLDVDGPLNAFAELDNHALPPGAESPHGNAFTRHATVRPTERAAASDMNMHTDRIWRISNATAKNALGHPTAYTLVPGHGVMPHLHPSAPIRVRAGFLDHHVWVTRYRPEELYAAGPHPNQSAPGEGLPRFIADDEPILDQDLVVWHTFGMTHNPRPEEWPIMSTHRCGFALLPDGFFARNPALDR